MLQNEMLGASVINVDAFRLIEGVQLLQMYNVAYYTGRNTERTILYVQDLQLHVNAFGRDAELTPYVQARRLGRRVILERTPNWDSERVMMLYLIRKGLNIFDERQLAKVCRRFGIPPKLECSMKLTKGQKEKKNLSIDDGPAYAPTTFTATAMPIHVRDIPRYVGTEDNDLNMLASNVDPSEQVAIDVLEARFERSTRINPAAIDDD